MAVTKKVTDSERLSRWVARVSVLTEKIDRDIYSYFTTEASARFWADCQAALFATNPEGGIIFERAPVNTSKRIAQ